MESSAKILILTVHRSASTEWAATLDRSGYDVSLEAAAADADLEALLLRRTWDMIVHLSAPARPAISAMKTLLLTRRSVPTPPFIVVDPHVDSRGAVELINAGAHDCLTSTEPETLCRAVQALTGRAANGEDAAEDEILASANAFRNAGEGILVVDADLHVKAMNPALENPAEELRSRLASDLDGGGANGFDDDLWQALQRELTWQGEIAIRRKDGSVFPAWASLTRTPDASGRISETIAVISDITVRKENEQEIRRQASFDSLTGLPNRLLFQDRFSLALARAKRSGNRIAVLFIDLDYFKQVNDIYGHADDDRLLVDAAERMRSCVRATDTIARVGDDEFSVVLSDLDFAYRAEKVAAKIPQAVQAPFDLGDGVAHVSASIGIAVYPDHGETLESLSARADPAMYDVKRGGRQGYRTFSGGLGGDQPDSLAAGPSPAARPAGGRRFIVTSGGAFRYAVETLTPDPPSGRRRQCGRPMGRRRSRPPSCRWDNENRRRSAILTIVTGAVGRNRGPDGKTGPPPRDVVKTFFTHKASKNSILKNLFHSIFKKLLLSTDLYEKHHQW